MASYDVIQHLSGTTGDWAAHNILIPNGEWAFEEMPNGSRQGKIGNGVDTWSELPYAFQAPPDPGTYNDWNKLWEFTCDGNFSTYTFTEDNLGNDLDYSEIYLEINCPSAAQTATTTIVFDESFTIYLTETTLPSTAPLVHMFHMHSQLERTYRAKGTSESIATAQFSKIFNNSGSPLNTFTFIHIFYDKGMNYPNGTVIRMWGK
jgi:hypothetical protein